MAEMQTFGTGATRNTDVNKFDYEGFLNPEALHAFGEYMHEHRHQKDGTLRDSDNWQKGIPFKTYVKSLVRHTIDLWRMDRGYQVTNPDTGQPHTKQELCCAIIFNAMGYLKELVAPTNVVKAPYLYRHLCGCEDSDMQGCRQHFTGTYSKEYHK